jgi:hypothetical protein
VDGAVDNIDGEGGIEDSTEDTESDMDSGSLLSNEIGVEGGLVDDVAFEDNSEGAEAVIDKGSSV